MISSHNLLNIVFSDESLLVLNKPASLLAVPGRGVAKQDCLSARLQQQFPDALVVHRLDMSTSGLMVFARGTEMQRCLSLMFQERAIEKRYIAVVAGKLEAETGEVSLPIAADWPNRPLRKIDSVLGKPSLTRYRVLKIAPLILHALQGTLGEPDLEMSRVVLAPVSGRTHQLRLHMAAIGHPVLGDALYGDASSATRLLLHAETLCFLHPLSGAPLHFLSPAPF